VGASLGGEGQTYGSTAAKEDRRRKRRQWETVLLMEGGTRNTQNLNRMKGTKLDWGWGGFFLGGGGFGLGLWGGVGGGGVFWFFCLLGEAKPMRCKFRRRTTKFGITEAKLKEKRGILQSGEGHRQKCLNPPGIGHGGTQVKDRTGHKEKNHAKGGEGGGGGVVQLFAASNTRPEMGGGRASRRTYQQQDSLPLLGKKPKEIEVLRNRRNKERECFS